MGDSSDKNDKTQLLSDSQVLEVKPSPAKAPPKVPAGDKNDRSVWKGLVVGADEFAPPPRAKSSGPSWLVLVILGVGVLGAGGYLWWAKLRTPAVVPDAAAKAVVPDALPQDAAPVAVPTATIDAPAEVPIDAAPDAVDAAVDAGAVDAGVKPIRRKPIPKHLLKRKVR